MAEHDFDAVVVGAGAVGLACGYALSRRGLQVAVLEREAGIGQGVSSRNSEVIHAGIYYPPGSLKARLCLIGRQMLYDFLAAHQVPFDRCGKLVVAATDAELVRLDAILAQLPRQDFPDVRRVSHAEAVAFEPELQCAGALLSPQSGVFDSHGYMLALQGEIESAGGVVALCTPFESARPVDGDGFVIATGGLEPTELTCRYLVTAPGLAAQVVAGRVDGFPRQKIPAAYLGKGIYFRLAGKAPFRHLIYPLPIPGALGTHYRRDLGGQAVFGPDLRYVHEPDYSVDPCAADGFYRDIRRFWPDLPHGALVPDYAGIRPKIHAAGEPQPDFCIAGPQRHGVPDLVALFGIESPGLTASLSIGEEVARMLDAPPVPA